MRPRQTRPPRRTPETPKVRRLTQVLGPPHLPQNLAGQGARWEPQGCAPLQSGLALPLGDIKGHSEVGGARSAWDSNPQGASGSAQPHPGPQGTPTLEGLLWGLLPIDGTCRKRRGWWEASGGRKAPQAAS